jgi:phosphatidylserine/phosphatidylglycerophosphate/cardiolipin synthase-like enzyme
MHPDHGSRVETAVRPAVLSTIRRMPPSLIDRADCALGDALERAMCAHHRRRLRRVGWDHALAAPGAGWARGGEPPRDGNSIEVLIDGETALPMIAAAIAAARSHVHIAGWCVTPEFALTPGPEPTILRELLADTADRVPVRVLLWGGAPLPTYPVSRRVVRGIRDELCRGNAIACALDTHERPMHCHHEKLVIVDDELAFVGGIDLTSFDGNRFDRPGHPARGSLGWHDVATLLRGPIVADVARHFALRWRESADEQLPPARVPAAAGNEQLQIVRTVPEKIYRALPRGEFSILASYAGALRSAEHLIYLENQFLWSPEIVEILREKLRNPPSERFRLLVVLPAKPNSGADDTIGQLGLLADADDGAGRMLACTKYALGEGTTDRVYVHAKVGLVDDRWLTIGSANLNEHSLFNDSEMNVVSHSSELARSTRLRLWAEHLDCPAEELEGDPATVIDDRWRPLASEQLERRTAGSPLTHGLVKLPHVSRRSKRLLGPLQSLVVDG